MPYGSVKVDSIVTSTKTVTVDNLLDNSAGSITSTMIADGTIVNADINASAAIADTKLSTISTGGKVANSATTATDANTASAIVARDASGNFSAGTITAALTGNASTATALATARNIQGVAFNGTTNITVVTAGTGITVSGTQVAVDLSDSTSSTSTTTAATPNAVKSAYDLANSALPKSGGAMTGAITFQATQTYPKIPANTQTTAYTLVASDAGKHVNITSGGVTIPANIFSSGDAISIYNNSASAQTITQGSSTTLRKAGSSETGNRTLAQYGLSTILCVGTNEFVISGSGLI
jgi:hypothetical protein